MNNLLTDDTKAILLLCGVFGNDRQINPLTQTQYNRLARWLNSERMRPNDLLEQENIDTAATGAEIDAEQLRGLLGRGVQLGFAVEEWQRNGIWVIGRSDRDYPERYKRHLKTQSPPLIFGIGNRALLHGGGLAVVGSRDADDADGAFFTRKTARSCVHGGMPVIFGGAGDIDGIAMTAALDAGGIAIGVLAGNLLKKSLARDARNAISSNRLLLVSPYHPNARFTIQSAMKRNRLIYALADYGLVVSAEYKKGGTWIGAMEELTRDNALGIFVRTGANIPLGNRKLLDSGAREWPGIESLFGSRTSKNPEAVKKSPDLGVCPGYGDRSEKV